MTLSRARSVDEIYEIAKSYDRIITKDAPLADALNYRLDQPRLETFASTPRGVVYRNEVEGDLRDRQELFLIALRETDLGWKETFFYLRQALNCWEETGSLRKVGSYDLFQSDRAREVLRVLEQTESVFRAMEQYDPDYDGEVAVVQPEKLSPLDRNVLPGNYDRIDPLTDEQFVHPPFNIYPSTTALIKSVTDNVNEDNARDVAVVVNPDDQYHPLLESELQKQDIPYMYGETLTDDEHFRTLFTMMRTSFSRARLRVRDVMPILHRLNLRIPLKFHDSFFTQYDQEAIQPFQALFEEIPGAPFEAILDRYEELTGVELETFRSVLETLGFLNGTITRDRLNQLEFYLSNFDEQVEKHENGVLFASPKAGAYVDRPIVFYLGMDASWTRTVPDQPWVDHDRQRRNNLTDFQVMIQNGQQQYYLVQEHQMNGDVTPCFYFNVLFEEEFETFSDRDHRTLSGLPDLEAGSGFDHEPREAETEHREAFSQSALKSFVKSPREYFFEELIPTVENVYMRKGQVFHDFAEFYVNYPDLVQERETDDFVDIMENAMYDLADEFSRHDMRTEFEIGIQNIIEFLEHEGYEAFEPAGYESDRFKRENVIAGEFSDRSIASPISEAWFEDPGLGVRGLVDLIPREDSLVDFKSGRRRSRGKVVEQASPDRFEDDPDFQVILYLLYHSRQYPDQSLQFTFFHFLENLSDVLQGDGLLKETLTTVTYYPRSFADQVPRKQTFEYLTASSKKRRKTLEGAGYDAYRSFFEDNRFPDYDDKDQAETSDLAERYAAYNQDRFKEANYVAEQSRKTFRKLIDFRRKNFFEEDFTRFERFLGDQLDYLNECYMTGFPVENGIEDLDLDDLNHRDLIVDDRYE